MQAFWKVVVPEIKPGIINGLLIAFTMSVDDFVISYFTCLLYTSGVSSFQWELRRLSRRALDTFLLGTAMGDTSFGLRAVRHFDYSLSFAIQQLRKGRQSWIYFRSAPAGTEIQVSPAFGTQPFAVV